MTEDKIPDLLADLVALADAHVEHRVYYDRGLWSSVCAGCGSDTPWPCDVRTVLGALDVAWRQGYRTACSHVADAVAARARHEVYVQPDPGTLNPYRHLADR